MGWACSTALAYVFYFRILAAASAANLLLVTFLIPVSAMVLGDLVLGETLLPRHFWGMALIAMGLAGMEGRLPRLLGRERGGASDAPHRSAVPCERPATSAPRRRDTKAAANSEITDGERAVLSTRFGNGAKVMEHVALEERISPCEAGGSKNRWPGDGTRAPDLPVHQPRVLGPKEFMGDGRISAIRLWVGACERALRRG